LVGCYIEVYHYADGRIELRANGVSLPFTIYDRLSEIDQGAIVDNKRLGHVLHMAQIVQAQRDNQRSQSVPANYGEMRKRGKALGKKPPLALNEKDIQNAINQLNVGICT